MMNQLLAVIADPQGQVLKKHLNCHVVIFYKDSQGEVHWDRLGYTTGVYQTGFRVDDFTNWSQLLEQYWAGKASLVKGCEWINQRDAHRELIRLAVQNWFLLELETSKCLVRFTAVFPIDPYHGIFHGRRIGADGLSDWMFNHKRYDLHYGRLTHEEWLTTVRPMVAALPVLPVCYQILNPKGLCIAERMKVVRSSLWRSLGDRLATTQWMRILSFLGVMPTDQTTSQKAIVKSVTRAAAKGKLSTRTARAWFKKHQILNRLNDGLKARKTQQPIEEIAA